ncbi:hypothetical protein GGD46_006036 [Rhizobium lusitanum]|uniref:Uncharacterized protein n=2 Tax=Rhizobium lusitanum TaxID=293958 RepID=A0A7X0IWZ0_9HYPH|nr:hypothetical protein [Rhizobium lusitanum]
MNENFPGLSLDGGGKTKQKSFALHPLHEAAMRLADLGLSRSRNKTKDLIGILLCHGARAWRYSQPDAHIHLHITAPSGRAPVMMRLR